MDKSKPVFDITDRGFNVKAWWPTDNSGDALIKIWQDDKLLREFTFPAYKVFNIAAHFKDIVDGELEKNADGYMMAASDGLGGYAAIKPAK